MSKYMLSRRLFLQQLGLATAGGVLAACAAPAGPGAGPAGSVAGSGSRRAGRGRRRSGAGCSSQ
ncbi:MAG: hypothetical protein R2932_03865 [Caldilineaceae bacterium]